MVAGLKKLGFDYVFVTGEHLCCISCFSPLVSPSPGTYDESGGAQEAGVTDCAADLTILEDEGTTLLLLAPAFNCRCCWLPTVSVHVFDVFAAQTLLQT
jgi:hypothetical protein